MRIMEISDLHGNLEGLDPSGRTEARFTCQIVLCYNSSSNKKVLVSTVPTAIVALEIGWREVVSSFLFYKS